MKRGGNYCRASSSLLGMSWFSCSILPSWGLAMPWWDRVEEGRGYIQDCQG